MNNKPLISVIVPIYNSEKYLDKCISSIVNQTYSNLEIILINDGSSDGSRMIIDSWASKDNRIKAIHKDNEGDVATRNMGLDIFNGDYVLMIDNDDYMDSDMVDYLYNLSINNDSAVTRCGFVSEHNGESVSAYSVKSNDIAVLDETKYDEKIIDLLMSDFNSGAVWNKLYRKDVILNHRMRKEDGAADDFLLNYRIVKDNPKLVISDEPKYHYLVRDDSMTGKVFTEGAFDIIKAKTAILEEFRDSEAVYPYAVKSFIKSALIVLTGCIKNDYFNDSYYSLIKKTVSFYLFVKNNGLFSKTEKSKLFILKYFPKLYLYLIRKKYGK